MSALGRWWSFAHVARQKVLPAARNLRGRTKIELASKVDFWAIRARLWRMEDRVPRASVKVRSRDGAGVRQPGVHKAIRLVDRRAGRHDRSRAGRKRSLGPAVPPARAGNLSYRATHSGTAEPRSRMPPRWSLPGSPDPSRASPSFLRSLASLVCYLYALADKRRRQIGDISD